jgi:hypothetical protein
VATAYASGAWWYKDLVFRQRQPEVDRLQNLVSRQFSGAENAAKYAPRIAELERLRQAAAFARRLTLALSGVSAAYDIYTCLQGK